MHASSFSIFFFIDRLFLSSDEDAMFYYSIPPLSHFWHICSIPYENVYIRSPQHKRSKTLDSIMTAGVQGLNKHIVKWTNTEQVPSTS